MQQIPLDNSPNQNFDVTLDIDGKNVDFNLFFSWNDFGKYWTLDIRDKSKTPLVTNLPLVINEDLLIDLDYLKIGKPILARISTDYEERPDINTIGTNYVFVWGGNENADSAS